MTSGLRKTHKLLWIFLAIAMPILIVISTGSIKDALITDSDIVVNATLGETIFEDEQFTISIHKTHTTHKVHIVLKKPLKSASSLVYNTPNNLHIGTITKKGVYAFELPLDATGIKIYDEIKEIDILNITL